MFQCCQGILQLIFQRFFFCLLHHHTICCISWCIYLLPFLSLAYSLPFPTPSPFPSLCLFLSCSIFLPHSPTIASLSLAFPHVAHITLLRSFNRGNDKTNSNQIVAIFTFGSAFNQYLTHIVFPFYFRVWVFRLSQSFIVKLSVFAAWYVYLPAVYRNGDDIQAISRTRGKTYVLTDGICRLFFVVVYFCRILCRCADIQLGNWAVKLWVKSKEQAGPNFSRLFEMLQVGHSTGIFSSVCTVRGRDELFLAQLWQIH